MKYLAIAIAATSVVLSGCASLVGASSASWPWPSQSNICAAASCTDAEALKAFVEASSFCREVQNYYESGGQRANSTKVAIGAVGAIAGTVIAPVANGSAAMAWSGLSGATNAVQLSIEEMFSSTVTVKRRAAVASAAETGATSYSSASDNSAKVIAAINMARSCAMSSAKADEAAVKALTQ